MGGRSRWGITPRQSVEMACAEHGAEAVIAGCVALIAGYEASPALVVALGGPRAADFLDAPPGQRYWLRVWGARGLLWAPWGAGAATGAIIEALADEHWRVREMAAKVVARHRVDEAQPAVARLLTDDVERVRVAASRAVRMLAGPDQQGAG